MKAPLILTDECHRVGSVGSRIQHREKCADKIYTVEFKNVTRSTKILVKSLVDWIISVKKILL